MAMNYNVQNSIIISYHGIMFWKIKSKYWVVGLKMILMIYYFLRFISVYSVYEISLYVSDVHTVWRLSTKLLLGLFWYSFSLLDFVILYSMTILTWHLWIHYTVLNCIVKQVGWRRVLLQIVYYFSPLCTHVSPILLFTYTYNLFKSLRSMFPYYTCKLKFDKVNYTSNTLNFVVVFFLHLWSMTLIALC